MPLFSQSLIPFIIAFIPLGECMVHNSEIVDIDLNSSLGGEKKDIDSQKRNWAHTFRTPFPQLLAFIQKLLDWGQLGIRNKIPD